MKDNKEMFLFTNLHSYKPNKLVERKTDNGYINYGTDNKYPDYIYDIYENCATLQSIINGSAEYTIGDGVIFKGLPESLNRKNSEGDTLEDIIMKITYDLWIFNGFGLQVQYNTFGQLVEIIYLDFRNIRTNEEGSRVYYNNNWNGLNTNDYESFPRFDINANKDKEPSQIFYYKGSRTRGTYPTPDYSAALISAETQIEIQKFHYSSIINNFMVNGVLNFNNATNIDSDIKDKIEKEINNKFAGAENAAKLLISWNEDKDKAVTFERLVDDNFDKKYEALAESTRDNLFISLRAIPVIFGLSVQTGFNTQEFKDAFALYNKTAIRPKQKILETQLKPLFGDIEFKKYNIEFEDEQDNININRQTEEQ